MGTNIRMNTNTPVAGLGLHPCPKRLADHLFPAAMIAERMTMTSMSKYTFFPILFYFF
jgi:hypothetical protein